MPTFAHSNSQPRAINLDNIDSIRKDNADGFEILFERGLFDGSSAGLFVVDRWRYANEKERDKAFKSILNSYGLPHG